MNSLKLSSICKSASQAVLSRMQLILHATRRTPHGASRLVQAICLVGQARHAPSRHCKDATGYGHSTTAMHEYQVYPPAPNRLWAACILAARRSDLFFAPGHEPPCCFEDPPVPLAGLLCCIDPQYGFNSNLPWSLPWSLRWIVKRRGRFSGI